MQGPGFDQAPEKQKKTEINKSVLSSIQPRKEQLSKKNKPKDKTLLLENKRLSLSKHFWGEWSPYPCHKRSSGESQL